MDSLVPKQRKQLPDRQIERQIERQTDKQTEIDSLTGRQIDRDRQTDRVRQADRQTGRQADTDKHRQTLTPKREG